MRALDRFLTGRPEDELGEPFTFVVDPAGVLRLAPRRSEHVACAAGQRVLAAGELGLSPGPQGWSVTYASNQSTGYCPDVTSWVALARSLDRAGVPHGPGFTHAIVYRRCPGCGAWNTVRDEHFACALCDADLPAGYAAPTAPDRLSPDGVTAEPSTG
jgi:hypothetical protein